MKDPKMDDLISTEWLSENLADVSVIDATLFLPDAGRIARAEHEVGHIPGAVFLDLAEFADFPQAAAFEARMRGLGVREPVVIYDNSPLHSAARAWWLLRSFGAKDLAVLDGGLEKWRSEGRTLESGMVDSRPSDFKAQVDETGLARKAAVLANGDTVVDARSAARFAGTESEPRPGLASGHIPGSRSLPQGQLFAADGTWKRPDDLRAAFAEAGVDLARPMITSCGSGVTAAVLSFGAHLLGKSDVRLYDGSWSEWGADVSTPKATGPA